MDQIASETDSGKRQSSLAALQDALTGLYTPRRLALVMLVQALLLAGLVTDSWHASPDSAVYMGLARSIRTGGGYTFNREPHVTYPPMFPLLLAGHTAVFGDSYLSINAAQAVVTLLCTPLAFLALRRGFGADMAFLGAGLLATNYFLWRTASMPLSDPVFCALVWLSLLVASLAAEGGRWRWPAVVVAGVSISAASLTRINGPVVIPAAVIAIWIGWKHRPRTIRALATAIPVVLALVSAWMWYSYVRDASPGEGRTYMEGAYFSKPLGQMAASVAENLFVTAPTAASNLLVGFSDIPVAANLLLPGAAIVGCLVCLRTGNVLAPMTVLAMLAVALIVPGITMRHLLLLVPFLFVVAPVGLIALAGMLRRRPPSRTSIRRCVLIVAAVLAAVHLGHCTSQLVKLRRTSVAGGHRMGSRQGWLTACAFMTSRGSPEAVLTQKPNIVNYLTRARGLTLKGAVFQLGLTDAQRGSMIAEQVRRYRPEYMLAEAGHPLADAGLASLATVGARATKIEGLDLTGSITLWRIDYGVARAGVGEGTKR